MIVWINGTFGVGKTTTAREVVAKSDGHRIFDVEWVGYMLRAQLQGFEVSNFQDYLSWRRLVPIVAREVEQTSNQSLVAVQTVLDKRYWLELRQGLTAEGMDTFHVVLDADKDAIIQRIRDDEEDPGALQWRLDHVDMYMAAREWMLEDADLVLDVSKITAVDAAESIMRRVS